MFLLRKILFPFAALYGWVTEFRNFLFDKGILKSYRFSVPVIVVGNLSLGGTGKTPQIEYLIRLLSSQYRIATLSRGYRRKSKGFFLADKDSSAILLGDEPFQFYQKFPRIQVAVDVDRKNGIKQLLGQGMKPQVILLDDAYQHRRVRAGFYILLTAYGDLYMDDYMLPMGNLREKRRGAKRADVVIVTKCPKNLSLEEQDRIRIRLKLLANQEIYFTFIDYDDFVFSEDQKIEVKYVQQQSKILVAGIAKPKLFFDYLEYGTDEKLVFPDHHNFTEREIKEINKTNNKIIITTEKDYVRLKGSLLKEKLFYLPIRSTFISRSDDFDKTILDYVGKSTENS